MGGVGGVNLNPDPTWQRPKIYHLDSWNEVKVSPEWKGLYIKGDHTTMIVDLFHMILTYKITREQQYLASVYNENDRHHYNCLYPSNHFVQLCCFFKNLLIIIFPLFTYLISNLICRFSQPHVFFFCFVVIFSHRGECNTPSIPERIIF